MVHNLGLFRPPMVRTFLSLERSTQYNTTVLPHLSGAGVGVLLSIFVACSNNTGSCCLFFNDSDNLIAYSRSLSLLKPVVQLPERVLVAIRKAEHETRDCNGFIFNICLSYGARQEIANACRKVAGEVTR